MKLRMRISFGRKDLYRAKNAPPWVANAIVITGAIVVVVIILLSVI
jgi:hypothetical protein